MGAGDEQAVHIEDVREAIYANTEERTLVDVEKEETDVKHEIDPSRPSIYLSGSIRHSNWRKQFHTEFGSVANILDPEQRADERNETHYVPVNLDDIDACDILVGFKERANPGIGIAHEIGYAFGNSYIVFLGKYKDSNESRYWGYSRVMADCLVDSFEELLNETRRLIKDWYERGE